MRKIFFTVIALLVTFLTNICLARSVSVTELEDFFGNWYDSKGNLVLTIGSDYRINGCIILSVDFDGTDYFTVKIAENNGYRDIILGGFGNLGCEDFIPNAYHRMLEVDKEFVLRDSKQQKYFESVGGIYLGMDKDQVFSLYGQPSSINSRNWNNSSVEKDSVWEYDNEGFSVFFERGVVTSIKIYNNSNKQFDWSGFTANNSKYDFERKYKSKFSGRNLMRIRHGEMITIVNNYIGLSIIDPYNAGFSYAD